MKTQFGSYLPLQIYQKLKDKGYFDLTKDEKIKSNKKCFGALLRSSKGDPRGERQALYDWRGEHNSIRKKGLR